MTTGFGSNGEGTALAKPITPATKRRGEKIGLSAKPMAIPALGEGPHTYKLYIYSSSPTDMPHRKTMPSAIATKTTRTLYGNDCVRLRHMRKTSTKYIYSAAANEPQTTATNSQKTTASCMSAPYRRLQHAPSSAPPAAAIKTALSNI